MKRVSVIIIIVFAISIQFAKAQKTNQIALQYSVGISTGDFNDYISQPSFRGFLFEYKKEIKDNIFIGIDASINTFYERKDLAVYTFDNVSISGIQYRYDYKSPILLSVEYRFMNDKKIQPFVNFGLGTLYSYRTTDMGIYSLTQENWQFVIKPEIGLLYGLSENGALKLSAKYFHAFDNNNMKTQSYLSFGVGYVFIF